MKEEMIDKLDFEDRIEYKLELIKNGNNEDNNFIAGMLLGVVSIILLLFDIIFLGTLSGIGYGIIYIISLLKKAKDKKELENKYFQIKPKDKKKK